jgi:2-aminoethylphosphonate-pyruvate transaminase
MDRSQAKTTDKLLFTPGPLTTSPTVKSAMLRDLGSRDAEFIATVKDVRRRLLGIAGVAQATGYEAVLMQGSGTFGVESVLSSCVSPQGKLLIVVNGAYGKRLVEMAEALRIPYGALRYSEEAPPQAVDVARALEADPAITHVAMVHCETTTGMMNPIEQIGPIVAKAGRLFIVDAMSSFGGVPIDVAACAIDYLVSSANKDIQGVPGFSFIVAWRPPAGRAASASICWPSGRGSKRTASSASRRPPTPSWLFTGR